MSKEFSKFLDFQIEKQNFHIFKNSISINDPYTEKKQQQYLNNFIVQRKSFKHFIRYNMIRW